MPLKKYHFLQHIKCQLISKGLFSFINSPQKTSEKYLPHEAGEKINIFSSFFGRIQDTKISFLDLLTFSKKMLPNN